MGASAFDAIETNPQLKPRKDKLTKDYITLSEHYEKVNQGLSDGEKYLFGLVVIPGKTPLWIELPHYCPYCKKRLAKSDIEYR
jgi:hypothetical protein